MQPDFSGGGYLTTRWRKRVAPLARGVPLDFVLAWIDRESDGKPETVSKLGERGLFQVHPDERDWLLALTPAQFAALTDPAQQDAAIKIGMRLVRKYAMYARRYLTEVGAEWHGRDFWQLVKLFHGAFALPPYGLRAFAAANGRGPVGWDEFRTWLLDAATAGTPLAPNDLALSKRLRNLTPALIANAEETGRRSGMIAVSPGALATVANLLRVFGLLA